MKPDDVIDIEILADGTIRSSTDKISASNHASADGFMTYLARLTGGETTIQRKNKHTHGHSHEKAQEKA